MRQLVIRYECDNCHQSVEEPQTTRLPRGKMPKDWLHVDGFSNDHSVFKLDLCEKCKLVIMEITESA